MSRSSRILPMYVIGYCIHHLAVLLILHGHSTVGGKRLANAVSAVDSVTPPVGATWRLNFKLGMCLDSRYEWTVGVEVV